MTGKRGNRREMAGREGGVTLPLPVCSAQRALSSLSKSHLKRNLTNETDEEEGGEEEEFICGTQKLRAAHQSNKNYTVSFWKRSTPPVCKSGGVCALFGGTRVAKKLKITYFR